MEIFTDLPSFQQSGLSQQITQNILRATLSHIIQVLLHDCSGWGQETAGVLSQYRSLDFNTAGNVCNGPSVEPQRRFLLGQEDAKSI